LGPTGRPVDEEGWASEESQEESEAVTDGEDDGEFNENAFEKLPAGASNYVIYLFISITQ